MDMHVARIGCYRRLLRQALHSETRRTLEWLLADAVRVHAVEESGSRPWDRYPSPRLVAIADQAVAEVARLTGSQFANMQLYVAAQDTLLLLAYRNFEPAFVGRFASFRPDGRTSCSRAVACGERVILEDVEQDPPFAPHVPSARAAGFRALQSTPLKGKSGELIGVLTTHFSAPRAFSNDELEELDAHASHVSAELARACG
ncbi:MAG TPA: GAF domain-containing protein [Croceibacterium sp.]